jgi:3-deoxy-D-manno-octulosonic-acid transferase
MWYTLVWFAGLPLVAVYLGWRSLRQHEYRQHWAERFLGHGARSKAPRDAPVLWVHAVSVGETRAAQPLIEQLARHHPQAHFVLTHMTPTGRAAGQDLAGTLPGRVQQRYLPYDLPFAVRRFLREVRPSLGVLMETEVWPNLLQAAHRQGVPVILANARLSQRSLAKALRFPRLMRGAAAGIGAVGAQSAADLARLGQLYGGPMVLTGNLKFDLRPDEELLARGRQLRLRLRAHFAAASGERPIWLFASTREGEERLLLNALLARDRAQAAAGAGAVAPLLLFVPRHPQRFDEVAELLRADGRSVLRRAQWDELPAAAPGQSNLSPLPPVLLGDTMGEMALYYAMADAALIGGSLMPLGGQNLIEACACACPVVLGPHMFNFAQAAADALAAGAACAAPDSGQALEALARISTQAAVRARMAEAAVAFATTHRGATQRTGDLIERLLAERRR